MKPYSQMVPRIRKQRLLDYNKRVRETEKSMEVLREWNLSIQPKLIDVEGHKLKAEQLLFGNNRVHE